MTVICYIAQSVLNPIIGDIIKIFVLKSLRETRPNEFLLDFFYGNSSSQSFVYIKNNTIKFDKSMKHISEDIKAILSQKIMEKDLILPLEIKT